MRILLILMLAPFPCMAMAAPPRAVSLNLCTDEYLLALAAPQQIVSLTHLGHDPHENRWAGKARRFAVNNGTIESVATQRPDLIVTMGGAPEDRAGLARRLGAKLLVLPYPQYIDDVLANMERLARALNSPNRIGVWRDMIGGLRRSAPAKAIPSIYVTNEGYSIAADGLSSEWMRLAGLRQQPVPGNRLSTETLLTMKPVLMLHSRYRPGQMARSQQWPGLGLIRKRSGWRIMETDGRSWLCGGPPMIDEIIALRLHLRG